MALRSFFTSDHPRVVDLCGDCGAEIVRAHPRHRRRTCDDCQRERTQAMYARRRANPVSPTLRAAVIARDGMFCRYCGRPVRERTNRYHDRDHIELDHVIPLVAGGRSTFENLVVSCMGCNKKKRGNVA